MNKFAYVLLASIILFGCKKSCKKSGETISTLNSIGIKNQTFRNFEYIIIDVRGCDSDFITHKGNCKFCAERAKINCK